MQARKLARRGLWLRFMGKQVIARVWRILAFAAAQGPRPPRGTLSAGRRCGVTALAPR